MLNFRKEEETSPNAEVVTKEPVAEPEKDSEVKADEAETQVAKANDWFGGGMSATVLEKAVSSVTNVTEKAVNTVSSATSSAVNSVGTATSSAVQVAKSKVRNTADSRLKRHSKKWSLWKDLL